MSGVRIDRLDAILDQVILHPETYNQKEFQSQSYDREHGTCGTAFCIAGWACVHKILDENPSAEYSKIPGVIDYEFVKTADEWLNTSAFSLGVLSCDHPIFDGGLSLISIIRQRNLWAQAQGLPAYIAPRDRRDNETKN